jgi:hypothetical protein
MLIKKAAKNGKEIAVFTEDKRERLEAAAQNSDNTKQIGAFLGIANPKFPIYSLFVRISHK